jgi:hypothetical protein
MGQVELQSLTWLQKNAADRPSFEAVLRRGLGGPRPFRVFALPNGLLFLELKQKAGSGGGGPSNVVVAGAVLGGAVGAVIGGIIAGSMSSDEAQTESGFDYYDEDRLIELARTRKRSFVAKYDEIRSVSIDAPGGFGRLFADRKLVGWITLRDQVLGKVAMELRDPSDMSVAVDALPRRLGDRVAVNVRLDAQKARFVPA